MKRLTVILTAALALALALAAIAAPALSTRPYRPAAVDFELAAPAGASAATRGVVSPAVRAPKRFNVVGFRWRGSSEPAIAIRTRRDGGAWSRWTPVPAHAEHAPDPGSRTERGRAGGHSDPVWAGDADWVQYRLSRGAAGLRLHFVNTRGTATAAERVRNSVRRAVNRPLTALARLVPTAGAQAPQPDMVPRSGWGGTTDCKPSGRPEYGNVQAALVHHTVSTNDYLPQDGPAIVLGICRYHRNSNGWSDIGYNFLVDKYGVIYEGRAGGVDRAVVGAQAQGFNSQTTGISNIGTFTAVPQSDAALDAMARLIRWKLPLHGQPTAGTVRLTSGGGSANRYPAGTGVDFERVSGHRDAGKTACPGDQLYAQLPELRARVGGSASSFARTKLDGVTIAPTDMLFPGPARAGGRLRLMNGQPLANAPVEVERQSGPRGWVRIASTTSNADGSFAIEVTPAANSMLRVRHPGGPGTRASASKRTRVEVRPLISADPSVRRAKVGQTPVLSGRIQPSKGRVVVIVTRRVGRRDVRVGRYSVRTSRGRFRKGHRLKHAGLHRFQVVFAGDRVNLPGTATSAYVRAVAADGALAARR